ncbi:MAG: ergothioneine biosynthesis protein EgtB [Rhodocyclaceae bacterium]|jgi:iron(II)-dependent oxidoreductase|nr:ergothioneine biosynthesis protein EgtB [Rhodocyclaceae bacterium]MCE2978564.1 SUMF1/EgtB/PvdO family nonheme iron enzyme [Betaproteobacteria bacterium]MCA3074622.1 ergothioneine biosynthesis protein EgtB [Rhodocyclaceae bacterium]MCA3088905.1 ergothioneine biosynthesis protein EgtB [Rhodocyclaceae bacterium]MCA3095641.1 ergothioneine biosynthesis protein EgtB [Rhodocyclaceae bacterium]
MSGATTDIAGCRHELQIARARMLALFDALPADGLLGPKLSIVNPPLWELGHLGWFQERWLLRPRSDGTLAPSLLKDADALYDSAAVAHGRRWELPLPGPEATRRYLSQVFERVMERLEGTGGPVSASGIGDPGDRGLAFHATVCAQHEQMHAEAFGYSRQTLGYPALPAAGRGLVGGASEAAHPPGTRSGGRSRGAEDAFFAGGPSRLGAEPGASFVYDNEKWAHRVAVAPFAMARCATSATEFAAFVDDGGYRHRHWWSDAGWAWRTAAAAQAPVYWRPMQERQGWEIRCHDAWRPLESGEPMLHVNAHEAEAWCRWAGRRLPTEAEWEYAASVAGAGGGTRRRHPWGSAVPEPGRANLWFPDIDPRPVAVDAFPAGDSPDGCRQLTGNVWEWTASAFDAYPGFTPDPYREYSQPWFGSHRALRGGSFATAASLIRNTWRNFYTPERQDVYAGFRTCALDTTK